MSLTLRCATVLSGADIEIKTPGPLKKNHGTNHPMQHPPSGCHGFHVTEDRGAIVVATRGSHLTDLPDL